MNDIKINMPEHSPESVFHVGTILSVIHDRNFSPQGMDGIYEILQHMTGEEALDPGDIGPAVLACAPLLREQNPDLVDVGLPSPEALSGEGSLERWLGALAAAHPPVERAVPRLPDRYDPATAHFAWLDALHESRNKDT